MAHGIVWSRRAAQDLDSIIDYIAADSPDAGVVYVNCPLAILSAPQTGSKL